MGSDPPSQITVYDGSVWIYEGDVVLRLRPGATAPTQKVTLPSGTPGDMAAGSAGIWVSDGDKLLRIDATSGTIAETHTVRGAELTTVITGSGSVWALDSNTAVLVRLKVESAIQTDCRPGDGPGGAPSARAPRRLAIGVCAAGKDDAFVTTMSLPACHGENAIRSRSQTGGCRVTVG